MTRGSNIDITMTGDTQDVIKAYARVIKQQDQLIAKFRKSGQEGKKSTKEANRELQRFADQTKRITATPLERYNTQMKRLKHAFDKGKLSAKEFQRASAMAKRELREISSPSFIGRFAGVTGGIAMATMGLRAYLGVMRQITSESDRVAGRQRESEGGVSQLAQVATSQKDFNQLFLLAKQMFAQGVGDSVGGAANVVFQLRSAGLDSAAPLVTELAGSQLIGNAQEFVRAAKTLHENLGEAETGGFRAIVSKAFGASQFSPATAESLLLGTSRGAQSAKTLGLHDEELLAANALAATAIGTAEEGGTAVASLLRSLVREAPEVFKGKSLKESVELIDKQGLGEDELIEFLGRQEAARAFLVLRGAMRDGRFDEVVRGVEQAQRGDEVAQRLGFIANNPFLQTSRVRRETEARNEIAKEQRAIMANAAQALILDTESQLERRGQTMRGFFKRKFLETSRMFHGDDRAFLQRFGGFANPEIRQRLQAVGVPIPEGAGDNMVLGRGRVERVMRDQDRAHREFEEAQALNGAAQNLNQAAKKLNNNQPPPAQVRQNVQQPVEN